MSYSITCVAKKLRSIVVSGTTLTLGQAITVPSITDEILSLYSYRLIDISFVADPAPTPAPVPVAPVSTAKPKICAYINGSYSNYSGAWTAADYANAGRYSMIFWNCPAYDSRSAAAIEKNISQIKGAATSLGIKQLHANYTILVDGPIGGQFSCVGSITRSGTTVRVNTVNQSGAPVAPHSTITTAFGSKQPVFIFYSDEAPAYNGGWVPTSVGATWWEFTATGGAATAPDVPSSNALCAYQYTVSYQMFTHIDSAWWVRKSGTSGRRVTWSSAFNTFNLNTTSYAPKNAAGRTCAEELAKALSDNCVGNINGLDYVYIDNYFYAPRPDVINGATNQSSMDYFRSGTPQLITDPTLLTAFRQGMANIAAATKAVSIGRAKSPSVKLFVNHDYPATFPEAMNKTAEAVLLEGLSGYKGWEAYNVGGIAKALSFMDGPKGRLIDNGDGLSGLIIPMSFLSSPTDYQGMRFGLGLSLLKDMTVFCPNASGGTGLEWYDEFDQVLGDPVDPPQSAPTSSGLYVRRYQKACVVVNGSGTAITTHELDKEGWFCIDATKYSSQDTKHNNGQSVASGLTVNPKDAYILVKP